MAESIEKPIGMTAKATRPQEFYDNIKRKFAEERDLRLNYRPEGTAQYTSDLTGELAKYEVDPYAERGRAARADQRYRRSAVHRRRILGAADCGAAARARRREHPHRRARRGRRRHLVLEPLPRRGLRRVAYDYLPLLDEMDYVPKDHYAKGPEIFAHCQAIARKYNLYDLAAFQTTVTSTVWDPAEQMWHIATDRGDRMKARFVICANGTLSKPKLSKINGMETFKGHSFHTSRWDYAYTGADLSGLEDKVVGIIGTGASAVQAIPRLGAAAKELYVFQRTPSSIDIRDDRPTDPDWARRLKPGWQQARRAKHMRGWNRDDRRAEGRAGRAVARGEDPPAGKREHRQHDAHPSAHRSRSSRTRRPPRR